MLDETQKTKINQIIALVLGLDLAEISEKGHFRLDFNASSEDLTKIKSQIETAFDLTLANFEEDMPLTVADLYVMVDDSSL